MIEGQWCMESSMQQKSLKEIKSQEVEKIRQFYIITLRIKSITFLYTS